MTVDAGPDFETARDESVRFYADLDPDDADVTVVAYEWRDAHGAPGNGNGQGNNGNGNGQGNGNNGGQSSELLSTNKSFETTLEPGQHTITLTVDLADGRTLSDVVNVTVRGSGSGAQVDYPPEADAGDCRMVIADEDTTLDGSESYDRDGTIDQYAWDLDGDNVTEATGETPTVQFQDLGNRTVELTVTDDGNNTDTDTVDLFVNDRPTARFGHSPDRPNPGETVTFDASNATDSLGGIERYAWDLDGDNVTDATGETISHAFAEPGDHTVRLVVTDAYGVRNATTVTVHVNHPPTADASDSAKRANVSESTTLDGTASTDPENDIVSYEWDVDADGEFEKTGETPTHAFDTAGSKNVTLRVTDDGGLTDTDTITLEVNAPPVADASESDQRATVGESATLDGSASTDDHGIATYEWDVDGDGEYEQTGESVSHAFASSGNKTVTLRVTDTWGVTDTDTVTVAVNAPPTARIEASNLTVRIGESVTFDGTDSADADGEIVSYEWDLDGDGTTDATGPTVEHAYSTDGTYEVQLTVTDDDGATATATRTITVLPEEVGDDPGVPGPPDDPSGGSGTGDPHMTTFDGRNYDFQAAGEFVLARAPNGSLSVQVRLDPVSGRPVSVIDAVATTLDGHNVTIDAADDTPLVVDGQRYDLAQTDSLQVGNGTVFRRGSEYVVVYPGDDGEVDVGDERLIVRERGNRLDVWLTLDADREHAVEGLLGTPDPDAPDVALANGTAVSPSDYDALYGPFRDDWRVKTVAQSHFHYEDGKSPDSFYDPDYPEELVTVEDLPEDERSAAEQAAIEAGLEPGTPAFENAVLDYATTEDESYLDSAATSQPANATFAVEAGSSFEANVSDPVTFVATVRNESAANVTVEWRFGDGSTETGTEVNHAYNATGTYTVTVIATGQDGGVARDSLAVTVGENVSSDQPPVPDVTVTEVNETHVHLDASGSVDPDGTVRGYAWDTDGDGTVEAYGESVTVALSEDPTDVMLVVLDDDGNRASTSVLIEATDRTILDEDFATGTAGFTSETGALETRSGDGIDVLGPKCSSSTNTNRVSKTLDADVDAFTYEIRVIPFDSWDSEFFMIEYRDDSGWHTIESDRFQWPNHDNRWPNADCYSSFNSPKPKTYSGTITDVDGTLYEIRFRNGLDQDDHDESLAIDYVVIQRGSSNGTQTSLVSPWRRI